MFVPFYPPHTGGVEYYAEELALYLSQSGCTITILTPQIPGTARYTQLENIQIIPYPAFEIIHNYPIPKFWRKNCWKIMSNLRNNPPNIIITHTRFFPFLIHRSSLFCVHKNPSSSHRTRFIFCTIWKYFHRIYCLVLWPYLWKIYPLPIRFSCRCIWICKKLPRSRLSKIPNQYYLSRVWCRKNKLHSAK